MLSTAAYRRAVEVAVAGTADAADGNLDAQVEHCPEFDVRGLLLHAGGFSRFVGGIIAGAEWEPSGAWRTPSDSDVGGDPIGWHLRCGAELIDAMEHGDPTSPCVTWAGDRTRLFWYRRAAQELSVHHWDAAHARGRELRISADVAVDGIAEFLGEFGPRIAARFKGDGERLRLVAADADAGFTITMTSDGIEHDLPGGRDAVDVTARADADVLLLFLWGRLPASALEVDGDGALLQTWQERVRI